jgi:hypothetical protein
MLYVLLIIGIIVILGFFWLLNEFKNAPLVEDDENSKY